MSTKLDSLIQHIATGTQRTQQQSVYLAVTVATGWGWLLTRQQIEEVTKIRTSSVCARLNELVQLGKVEEHGTKVCHITGKTVNTYRTKVAVPVYIYQSLGDTHAQ